AQILVAADVVQSPNDKQQLEPMLEQVERNVGVPQGSTADAGSYGEATIEKLEATGIELLVPPDRHVHRERAVAGALPQGASTTDWMRYKLRTAVAAALYRMRKAIVLHRHRGVRA